MNWVAFISNIIAHVPIERALFPPRDNTKALEEFITSMEQTRSPKEAPVLEKPTSTKTSTIQETEKAPEIKPQSHTSGSTAVASKLTSEETLAYQKREIAKELWQLEKHMAQGCRIPDKTGKRIPCDCCEKGSFIAGLAYESIPIAERAGQPSNIFEKIAQWSDDLTPMVTVAAVESGQYDYKKLSGEASALRKELMGTLTLSAMAAPAEE